ncbi:ABC transporter permease [Georgenia sp. Z1344]|uniref:ABC transporter permease n=1 Tax=Georgenia sp. Z1344 TaxID=3416706 RepID=UPI003CE821EC
MSTAVAPPAARGRVTWLGTLRSEFIKFFSLRSTWWVLGIGVLLYVAFQWATVWGITDSVDQSGFPGLGDINGVYLLVLVAGMLATTSAILGVLTMTSEYSTGMIRATLAAQPSRIVVLLAKTVLIVIAIAVQTLVAFLATWAVGNPYLSDVMDSVSLTDGDTWRVVGLFVLYTVTCGVLGVGFGAIFRSTAAGISAVLVLLMLVPIILEFLPWEWVSTVRDLLPSNVAADYLAPETGMLGMEKAYSDTVGALVSTAWAAVPLAVGGVLMVRRDA